MNLYLNFPLLSISLLVTLIQMDTPLRHIIFHSTLYNILFIALHWISSSFLVNLMKFKCWPVSRIGKWIALFWQLFFRFALKILFLSCDKFLFRQTLERPFEFCHICYIPQNMKYISQMKTFNPNRMSNLSDVNKRNIEMGI